MGPRNTSVIKKFASRKCLNIIYFKIWPFILYYLFPQNQMSTSGSIFGSKTMRQFKLAFFFNIFALLMPCHYTTLYICFVLADCSIGTVVTLGQYRKSAISRQQRFIPSAEIGKAVLSEQNFVHRAFSCQSMFSFQDLVSWLKEN